MTSQPLVYIVVALVVTVFLAPLIPLRRRRLSGLAGFPAVTLGLLLTHCLLFAATITEGKLTDGVAAQWGMVPRSATLLTLFTHVFLHGTWTHLLSNMLGLWLFGPHVEEALGKVEFLLFYIGGGVAAGLMHVLLASTPLLSGAASVPLVGASGAIFAILGLFAVRFWRAQVRVLLVFSIPAVWAVGLFAAYQVFLGVASFADAGKSGTVANWAHVGGFLYGLIIALPLKMREESRHEYNLEDAEKALNEGRYAEAAEFYRRFLAGKPENAPAHHALARACVHLRQGEAAHRHFMDALRLYLRGEDAGAVAGVYEDACVAFEAFPLPPALLQRVASACEEAGRFPLAARALSELCRDFPDAKEAEMGMIRLGRLHLQKLNQPQSALGVFSEFLRLYPSSEWRGHAQQLWNEAEAATHNVYSGGGVLPPAAAPQPR
ncbi:MAG TPA: rhomboid family intramembrane serine protease [Armatimonadaceae bacterium]|nr:rhomboid family intramembrane serine protease [Armatimonadaceae bacterium]